MQKTLAGNFTDIRISPSELLDIICRVEYYLVIDIETETLVASFHTLAEAESFMADEIRCSERLFNLIEYAEERAAYTEMMRKNLLEK